MPIPPVSVLFRLRTLFTLCAWLALAASAEAARVDLVLSERSPIYLEAAEAIRAALGSHQVEQFAADGYASGPSHANGPSPALVVTLGTAALERVVSVPGNTPVLATLVPRSAFERLAVGRPRTSLSAIYLDQPYDRQLRLVRAVLPEANRVGVVASPEWQGELTRLTAAARERRLRIVHQTVADAGEIHAALTRLLPEVDVLLCIPDAQVFNATTLPNILLSTYRAKRPVVGFSPYYVRAGALAAVHSTPTQLGRQAGEVAARVAAGAPLPRPQPPRYFSVTVNATVARSLDLDLEEEAALAARLADAEREP